MFEIFLMGTSDTNADKVGYAKFHVFCKQQFGSNGSWIKFLGHDNMASNIAYKYTAGAGDNYNGLYEIWVKSLHKYGRPHVLVTQNTGFKIETLLSNVGYEQPSEDISQASDWLWNI